MVTVEDESGSTTVTLFNKETEQIVGIPLDKIFYCQPRKNRSLQCFGTSSGRSAPFSSKSLHTTSFKAVRSTRSQGFLRFMLKALRSTYYLPLQAWDLPTTPLPTRSRNSLNQFPWHFRIITFLAFLRYGTLKLPFIYVPCVTFSMQNY